MKTGAFIFGISTVKVLSLFPFFLFFSFLDFKLNNFEKSKNSALYKLQLTRIAFSPLLIHGLIRLLVRPSVFYGWIQGWATTSFPLKFCIIFIEFSFYKNITNLEQSCFYKCPGHPFLNFLDPQLCFGYGDLIAIRQIRVSSIFNFLSLLWSL